ncbi:MAG: bifunctional diguanylate cyclase/phosphodiesterase [Lachnospiraceae bacterium]|nr:bifunctional diguanylate cyclase/phosphodiesterase [Lachnospiraceae bacterium]
MDELHYQIDLLTALNHKLKDRETMYQLICETSQNAFIFYDFTKKHIEVLGSWNSFFNFQVEDVKDLNVIVDCTEDKFMIPMKELLFLEKSGKDLDSGECCLADHKTWIEIKVSIKYDEGHNPLNKTIRIQNITHGKIQKDELLYMAYYDGLTGLYNRNKFVKVLSEWIKKAVNNEIISVMFVDIDGFRKINDGMGMIVGDELVQQFGQFLNEFNSDDVIISHFTSDIFCIAIYDPCGSRSVEYIYNAIEDRITKPFLLSDRRELTMTVSYGVAEYPEAATTAVELINYAEIVMFRSKKNGKGSIQYFNAKILDDFLQNVVIEHKLKEAIAIHNFTVCYQPQYSVKTHALRGIEALIRWQDLDGTMVSPSVFIPIAEKNGLIISIGDWIIEESIKTYADWKQRYRYAFVLSINISAIQYRKRDFIPKLLSVLKKYNIECKDIELEITESVLIEDFDDVVQKMLTLRDYGIHVSLDDFGTGFSSLSYLKGLPINTLKIDKSFIDSVTKDEASNIIVNSIITMAQKLGFEIIAEGVETREQYDYLKGIGCNTIQGFLLGKPKTYEEMEALLSRE